MTWTGKDELSEISKINKQLNKRQDAFDNTIKLLIEQLAEKELQLESKEESIRHIPERSIVQLKRN